jgi:hypothetical protein
LLNALQADTFEKTHLNMCDLEIVVKRADRTYLPGEKVTGYVQIKAPKGLSHQGMKLIVDGGVSMTYSQSKNVSLWEAMISSMKPIKLIEYNVQLAPAGKIPDGETQIPFEFLLKPTSSYPLFETYNGVYLSVRYTIAVEMARGIFARDVKKTAEFVVVCPGQGFAEAPTGETKSLIKPLQFKMTPEKLKNVRKNLLNYVPEYTIEGVVDSNICDITKPFTGELIVKSTAVDIKAIELQLVRVESCAVSEGMVKEATEIQNLQIGDGNVCKEMPVPLFMVFPRFFTCPSLITTTFRVEFEMNLIILFTDGHQITENFGIHLYRPQNQ